MAKKRIKRPRDPVQLGKLIGDIATGQVDDVVDDGKDEVATDPLPINHFNCIVFDCVVK